MNCPAPPGFLPALAPQNVRWSRTPPPFVRQKRYTGRRAEGIRYERKVQGELLRCFPDTYVAGPWLRFNDGEDPRVRWCQPDGVLFQPLTGRITIVEIKYSHTSAAWWQTTQLYAKVLAELFPERLWQFDFCEVVKWFDPAIAFPVPLVLAAEPDMLSDHFKVHILKP